MTLSTRISELPSATALTADDVLALVNGGVTKKATIGLVYEELTNIGAFVSVKEPRFGAVGDGVTDDMAAIQAAITALIARGGGTLLFPNTASNVYYLGAAAAGSVNLPVLTDTGTAFAAVAAAMPYHFYLLNEKGITFKGDGVTLKSGVTNGGCMFIFDGCRDIVWDGIVCQSVMAFVQATGAVTTVGMQGLGFTSTARDSDRIRVLNYTSQDCYCGFYAFGDGAGAYRARNIVIDNALFLGGEYGIAAHNNGDNITFNNVRVSGVNGRAYFAYGAKGHQGQIQIEGSFNNLFGLVLVKAYDQNTQDIALKVNCLQVSNGGVAKINCHSQHYVATQPTPALLRNINIDLDDNGLAGDFAIFKYFQGATDTTTAANLLFNNIELSGMCQDGGTLTTTVTQTPLSFVKTDRLKIATNLATALYRGTGMVPSLDALASATFNDASAHTLCVITNNSGFLDVRDAGGVVRIPFWSMGGNGVNYQWTILDPDTGWLVNQTGFSFSFVMAGTGGQTYTVAGVAGTGNLTVQRTVGAAAFNVYVEAVRNRF